MRRSASSPGRSWMSSTGRWTGSTWSRPSIPGQEALRVVAEDGITSMTYGELAARSNQVANWLRSLGARRGDRLLLMLGNIAPLWEVILAALKLGVVIIPASTLLSPDDLADRIDRGEVRHVVTETAQRDKFAGLPDFGTGGWTAVLVEPGGRGAVPAAGPTAGIATPRRSARPREFTPDGPTRASDPLLLYFTSGTTAQPKLVEHTQVSYPVGHLSTMYWIGLRPGDTHLNISSPGWAKHAWSNVFAPWIAEATTLILGYERFSADLLLRALGEQRVSTFCAPPTVWRMLIQSDLSAADVSTVRECVAAGRAAQPGGHRAGQARPGTSPSATATARPRRPRRWGTALASRSSWARWAGRCPGTRWRCSTRSPARPPRRANSAWTCPAARSA